MQSGLCCIPGFSNPADAKRKGIASHALLESLAHNSTAYNLASRAPLNKLSSTSVLPPLPKPPSTYQTQNHASHNQIRTSSGPPFISPCSSSATFSMMSPSITTTMSLSNSVDSVLSDASPGDKGNSANNNTSLPSGGNVFTPAIIGLPKGLPPRGPATGLESSSNSNNSLPGKSRSLERNKTSSTSNAGEPFAGKYTVIMYDGARCRSLDRREIKSSKMTSGDDKKPEKESKVNLKSSVSSKAAFFGQLLTRRSPSPSREKKEKDKDKESSTPKLGRRFPFGGKSQSQQSSQQQQAESSNKNTPTGISGGDQDVDAMLLDKQGRSSQSQRNRISSKWSSSNTLEAVEEQSGSESPWVQRKNKSGSGSESPKVQKQSKDSRVDTGESNNKKWGRIVKTPFGLRYTFGSPRVAALALDSSDNRKMSG